MLLLPPGFHDGDHAPLVIGTKPYYGEFLCDSGGSHFPSFAPQPLAAAGMLYLVRTFPDDFQYQNSDPAHYPKTYPDGIGEAALQMDIWDSAVQMLEREKLIDRNKVSIIGYSRSRWYTEFILAHSTIPYAAATAADNVQYSMGEYWLRSPANVINPFDQMYGGRSHLISKNPHSDSHGRDGLRHFLPR